MSDPARQPSESLRTQAIRSAKWVLAGRVVAESTSLVALVALARLLTPAQVGHAAVAMVAFALSNGLLGGSFGSILVKQTDLRPTQVETAQLLSLASGVMLTALCLVLAAGLSVSSNGSVAELIAVASPCFLFAGISSVPQALRSRRLAFRALTLIEMAATVTGSATSVALAALGAGAASVVLGGVAMSAAVAALSLVRTDARRPRLHRHEVGEVLRFGLPASGSSILFTAVRNIDYALVATRLPAAQVGFYYRAYTLAVDYQLKISQIVVRVLFPVLSRTATPEAFRSARSRVIRLHSVVLFPLLAMLVVTAPTAVPLLYGDRWNEAILPTQILVGAGVATAIGTGIGPVMLAAGKPRPLLVNNIVTFACFALTVYVCAGFGLIATCVGVVAYRLIALAVSQYCLATRLLGIPLRDTLVRDPGPAAISAAALLAVAFPLSAAVDGYPPLIRLAVTAAAGFAVYGLVLRVLFSTAWSDVAILLAEVLPRRLRRASSPAVRPRLGHEG